MITGGEQKPGAARETSALGPNPELRKEPPFLVVRKSFYGYLVASLTVLLLWGTLAFGVVGCSTLLSGFGWWHERPGTYAVQAHQSSREISRLLRNAHYYNLMGRPDLALKQLEQAHQENPDNLKIINSLAQNYEELGKFEAARQLYQEGLTRHGPNPVLTNNLCFTYYLEGRYQKAEECFRQALARDPQNVAARNNLGLLYCRQGRQDKARRLWQAAEGDASANYKVHQALAALGMYDGAVYAQGPEPTFPEPEVRAAPKRTAAFDNSTTSIPAEVHTSPQPVASKPAPQPLRPVAARVSPTPKPKAAVHRPLASQTEQFHASQPATPKKASIQVAQAHKPTPPRPVVSNTDREKARVYAQAQPITPKTTAGPLAQKPAPQTPNPVAARVSPTPKPEAAVHRPLASQTEQFHASQPATPKKASIQMAQAHKPTPPRPVVSNIDREKARVYAQAQPITPKTTARPAAHKPAPQTPTPVVARIKPTPRPGVGIARLATRNSAKVQAQARLVKHKKSSQPTAQKPTAKMPLAGVTPQGKVLEQAASGQTRLAQAPIVAASAPPLMYPRYLTCLELVNTAIEVRNGTWTRFLAHEARSMLSLEGFNVTKIGNHIDFGAQKTIIFYRPGSGRVARALGHTFFPLAELKPSMKLKKGTDVKILLGADLLKAPRLMARLESRRS